MIEQHCQTCQKKLYRTQGEINKRIKRGLKNVFCRECALVYAKKRMHDWNIKNNPKEWHRKTALNLDKHYEWKGKTVRKDGYCRITVEPNNRKLYHRYLIEKEIKRSLLTTEIIHHKDGNPSNNSIDNLLITNRREHMKLHYA